MSIEKRECTARSSDGTHTLRGVIYLPEGEPRGYYQIVHGMAEHMGRYETLMKDLAEEGFIAFGCDHLGHGRTATEEELGFIASKDGWKLLIQDVSVFYGAVRQTVGREDLPYFLMGHSMGSFIVRLAVEHGASPDRLIVMGTGGPNPASGVGLLLIRAIRGIYGERHVSKLIQKLIFGGYCKRYKGEDQSDATLWLSSLPENRRVYFEDPRCGFLFSISAMGDLVRLMKECNRRAWFEAMPKDLPILLISGREDPVGNFGSGVEAVRLGLEKAGARVSCILYEGARHEILNDFTYGEVKGALLNFIK